MQLDDMTNLNELRLGEISKIIYGYSEGNFAVEAGDVYPLSEKDQETLDRFHEMYFRFLEQKSGLQISWLGNQTGKIPADLWIYQEMIVELKPEVIVECGTHLGGSAMFLASICQLIGKGRVVTVDLYPRPSRPSHHLVDYVNGSSIDPDIVKSVKANVGDAKNVLVILDSDHSRDHVLSEMRAYKDLVLVDGYLIVEDTFLNGHPSHADFGPGPMEAIDDFLAGDVGFVIDRKKEHLLFTLNRRGFLRRIK